MVSKTKYPISTPDVQKIFRAAGFPDVRQIRPLGAGMYNAVYEVLTDKKSYVIKIAPPSGIPVMTYERGIMRAELYWYRQMREKTGIRVPEIYAQDFDHAIIPADYFIMEKLEGKQFDQMDFTPQEKAASSSQLAKMAAQIHRIRNDRFGYIQNELYTNWYQAIRTMVSNILQDAARLGKRVKRGERLLQSIDRYQSALEKAECCMVNFDIWAPNILCIRGDQGIEYAWIDPERSFWGDRIADFVCLEMSKPLHEKKKSLAAYNRISDHPVTATREEEVRLAVAQGYLALIQEVEKYYRYTPRNQGWWLDVFSSRYFYAKAFGVLK